MKIITMSVRKIVDAIDTGYLAIRHTTAFSPNEAADLFDSIERGWPIGLITATPLGDGLEVVDGGNRLGCLYGAMTGSHRVVRLPGEEIRYSEDEKAEGVPMDALHKTVRFLTWSRTQASDDVACAHDLSGLLDRYEVPFAVVSTRPQDALRVRLNA